MQPRPDYPRPRLVRDEWINLNGEWQFQTDPGKSGREREWYRAQSLSSTIQVPFCPESPLSGAHLQDFVPAVWYCREFFVPKSWRQPGKTVLLHFGAVDYETEVWVNGISAGTHRGGYTPFALDITPYLKSGANTVTVCAEDELRSGLQPRGKQSFRYFSKGAHYTRTTGIWQTVWLESVPTTYLADYRVFPDPDNGCVHLEVQFHGFAQESLLKAEALWEGASTGEHTVKVSGNQVKLTLQLNSIRLWACGQPNLYDLKLTLTNDAGEMVDLVQGYFGLRTVSLSDRAILLNGEVVFQRLVLDQGYYPDGIYTAPTDDHLKRDIEMAMELGFNGARMHQKVFEPRYLYWADRLGFLVWGEYADWGLDITTAVGLERFLPEWMEAVQRDFNHPSLVGWCPFNETWDRKGTKQNDEVLRTVYRFTKLWDPTRPVIDASGNFHVVTDIFDVHDYDQDVESFRAKYGNERKEPSPHITYSDRQRYEGQPYMVSEYGGIWWKSGNRDEATWGYGNRPADEKEFLSRYAALTTILLENPTICGFCYTQLYDVEQETNGLYTYDRVCKFNPQFFRNVNTKRAAIEL